MAKHPSLIGMSTEKLRGWLQKLDEVLPEDELAGLAITHCALRDFEMKCPVLIMIPATDLIALAETNLEHPVSQALAGILKDFYSSDDEEDDDEP